MTAILNAETLSRDRQKVQQEYLPFKNTTFVKAARDML
jgi:hypothetical protein